MTFCRRLVFFFVLSGCVGVARSAESEFFRFSGRLFAEFETAYLSSSGTLCDTKPTALQNLDWTIQFGDYGKLYGYGAFLSMMHDQQHELHRPASQGYIPLYSTIFFFLRVIHTPVPFLCYALIAQSVKNLTAMQKTRVPFLGQEDPLEKEMAAHFSILAWKIPWTEEPGGLHPGGHRESDTTEGLGTCTRTLAESTASEFL